MEDRVRITADASDYESVMRRAGNTADQFTSRIQKAHTGFTGLFKRSPDMRAERAMSGFIERVAQGDIAGGLAQISSRMTGIGLVAGVAIIAGVEVFKKFKEQIDATRAAHEALQMEMLKRPLSTVTSLSAAGMEQALQTREKLTGDLRTKSEHTFGSEIFEAGQSLLNAPGANFAAGAGKERIQEQKTLNEAILESQKIMLARAELAMKMVGIRRQELEGDQRQAEIAKIGLATDQARAALKEKGLTSAAFKIEDKAILQNEELSLHQLDKKTRLQESQLAMEEKIAALQHKGLAGEDLKKVKAGLDIQLLDQEIAGETSPLAKRTLQLQRHQKVNEAHGLLSTASGSNPFPFGTASNREFGRAAEFGQRNIEGALGFGGLARGAIERGETGGLGPGGSLTPEDALLKTNSASSDEIAGYKKSHGGELPGGKNDGQSLAVTKAIKDILESWDKG